MTDFGQWQNFHSKLTQAETQKALMQSPSSHEAARASLLDEETHSGPKAPSLQLAVSQPPEANPAGLVAAATDA